MDHDVGKWRWPAPVDGINKEPEDLRAWKAAVELLNCCGGYIKKNSELEQELKRAGVALEDLRSWKQQAIKANGSWDRVRELLGSQEFGLHCGDDLPKAAADWLSRCRSYLNRIRVLEDELKAAKEILNAPPCRDSVDQENAEYWKTRALIDEELVKKWEEKNFWAAGGVCNEFSKS
jgi:hypothetical protein